MMHYKTIELINNKALEQSVKNSCACFNKYTSSSVTAYWFDKGLWLYLSWNVNK